SVRYVKSNTRCSVGQSCHCSGWPEKHELCSRIHFLKQDQRGMGVCLWDTPLFLWFCGAGGWVSASVAVLLSRSPLLRRHSIPTQWSSPLTPPPLSAWLSSARLALLLLI